MVRALYGLLLLSAVAAQAQDPKQGYPGRPIRLIVPSAPGGGQDIVSRALAARLTEQMGQTVVVDNRGGGGGSVGTEITKQAPPDGYTINLMSVTGVVRPLMYASNYDVLRDFIPVSQITSNPYVLVVHPAVPAKSVQEFVAHAKGNPGKLNYSSSGPGSLIHLGCALFNIAAGISTVHVPYKGTGAAYPDLIAGNIQWTLANITSSQPHVRAQRLRALAVSSATRAKAQPELPTIAESGVKGFEVTQWYGILAPARTPRAIVDRLNKEIVRAVQQPDLAKRFSADGTETLGSSPAQFLALLKTETVRWAKVIKETGVRGD